MNTKLYVGNLPYETSEADLRRLFEPAGTVTSVSIPTDRNTGQARGFAFVEMATDAEAKKAIGMCNGQSLGSRQIRVNISEPRDSGNRSSSQRSYGRY
jgi:RNA recognition motif-containing protein